MKIGILTFHYAHNYGAMLQAYALKRYLNERGYIAEIINYVPGYMRLKYFHVSPFRVFLTCRRSVIKSYFKRLPNSRKFTQFEEQFLDMSEKRMLSRKNLFEIEPEYDAFIFGSDQVWNTNITKSDQSYFGDFTSGSKRIAYAASLGNAMALDGYDTFVRKYVSEFRAVSVREQSAKDYITSVLSKDVTCVLDPVFLLNRERWNSLAESVSIPTKGRYVFYYTVQGNDTLAEECNAFAKQNEFGIYTAHGEMKKSNKEAELLAGIGPLEFISLIKNAEVVFTNSFHAAAFSIIFGKSAYLRVHTETGNRITDLLGLCGCFWDGRGLFEIKTNLYDGLKPVILTSCKFLKSSLKKEIE